MGIFRRKPPKPPWHQWVAQAKGQQTTASNLIEENAAHPSVRRASEEGKLAKAMTRLDFAAKSLHGAYRAGASCEEIAREWLGDDDPGSVERVRAVLEDGAALRQGYADALPDMALPDTGWHESALS
ncbi:hypothetical protein [Miltoncostaea oceani]|uniref:hypothetical protein n=1 Tax=Miltoncostaea oceani TaxID=2843216 RepID=UPI001C3E573C|nr:hypothetical protein [Miltoncostaea oceani]